MPAGAASARGSSGAGAGRRLATRRPRRRGRRGRCAALLPWRGARAGSPADSRGSNNGADRWVNVVYFFLINAIDVSCVPVSCSWVNVYLDILLYSSDG